MKWFPFLIWSILVFRSVPGGALQAGEVSRSSPEIYQKKILPQLTPLPEVASLEDQAEASGESGAILLWEDFDYVDESGKRYVTFHVVLRAVTDAGARVMAQTTLPFPKGKGEIHLVLAQSIQPDGSRQEVRPDAAMIRTPQQEADKNMYRDWEELFLIFPNVKKGTLTEFIVVSEQYELRLPGEFSSQLDFAKFWPIVRRRSFLELPESFARRLKIQAVGEGIAAPAISEPEPGRKRYSWLAGKIPSRRPEVNGAGTVETGPVAYLTTLADWNTFAKWYDGELKKTSRLGPALTALLEEWTKDLKDPDEIRRVLLDKVAANVRDTGVKFGDSELKPHDCNEVWENRYGDGKDKANLLAALLNSKGIPAYVVLLNKEHAGGIEKRSPDFRDFNHAMVAVGETPADFVFCDPTVEGSVPGLIAPASSDREVLVIRKGEAVWARTPVIDIGRADYDWEVTLDASGELRGWMTLQCNGNYAALFNHRFRDLDRKESGILAQKFLRNFYPEASLVDFEIQRDPSQEKSFKLRAYLLLNASKPDEKTNAILTYPSMDDFFPELGEESKRRTSFFNYSENIRANILFHLPPGWTAAAVPEPFRIESKPLQAAAQWNNSKNACQAAFDFSNRQGVIPADEFEAFRKNLKDLRAWLSKPLPVTAPALNFNIPQNFNPKDFPVMPTGEGQLTLVDHLYPEKSGNLHVLALQQVIELFPNDPKTQFTARVKQSAKLLELDRPREAAERIKKTLQTYGKDVDAQNVAWAEYLGAMACLVQNQDREALETFLKLASREELIPYRRAWSAYQAGILYQKEKNLGSAVAMLEKSMSLLEELHPSAMVQLADIDYSSSPTEAFPRRLRAFLAGPSTMKDETVMALCQAAFRTINQNPIRALLLAELLNSDSVFTGLSEETQAAVKKLAAESKKEKTNP